MSEYEKPYGLDAMRKIAKILLFGVDFEATDEMLNEVQEYAEYVKFKHSKD